MLKTRKQFNSGIRMTLISVSLLLCSTIVMAQSMKTGRVTDTDGEPCYYERYDQSL